MNQNVDTHSSDATRLKQSSSPPAGYLLNRYGLLAAAVGLAAAAWYGQIGIVILLGLLLSSALLARLWSRVSLLGVTSERSLSENRAFPGETIELSLRLANRKLVPLPWVQVEDEVPRKLLAGNHASPGTHPNSAIITKSAAVLWYSRVTWRQTLECSKRGYYRLGPITVRSGDIFGFYPRSMTNPLIAHIIVYPRIYPIAQLGLPSNDMSGDTRAERRILDDPTRISGIRDYTTLDSLKHVHWKASARHQNLQVKVFEPSTSLKAAVFLAVDSFPNNDEEFEMGISTAASIADYLVQGKSPTGLFVNTCLADSEEPAVLPPASGVGQLAAILELLAKVTHTASGSFEEFVQNELGTLPWGTSLVFVVSRMSEPLSLMLEDLKHKRYKTLLVRIGQADGAIPGSPQIKEPQDLAEIGVI